MKYREIFGRFDDDDFAESCEATAYLGNACSKNVRPTRISENFPSRNRVYRVWNGGGGKLDRGKKSLCALVDHVVRRTALKCHRMAQLLAANEIRGRRSILAV